MEHTSGIKPKLRIFDLTMIMTGLVIGMGIFRVPAEVAQNAGRPTIFFLAWIAGAIVSGIGALTFAEIGSRYPVAGGFYKIFSHCYHPAFAFMVNWILVISNAAATAGVAIIGAEYMAPVLLPALDAHYAELLIAALSILLIYVINMLGIRMSARMLNVLMMVKIGLILLIIAAVFFAHPAAASTVAPPIPDSSFNPLKAFALCFIPVFFSYGGYQHTMNFGNDIADARRNMPRAILMGIAIVLALYLGVNYAYYRLLGFEQLAHSKTIVANITHLFAGETAHKIVSLLMFLSVMAYVNVSAMANPRIYYAMAEDKILPPIFKKLNARTQVQEFALSLFCVFMLLTLVFLSSFQKILQQVMFFDSISLICAAATLFLLRRKAAHDGADAKIFRMKGYPFLPLLYILVYLVVIVMVFYAKPAMAFSGFILFLSGLPLYYIIKFALQKQSSRNQAQ
jgi:APA family basic amino acid/polyamine antiporter